MLDKNSLSKLLADSIQHAKSKTQVPRGDEKYDSKKNGVVFCKSEKVCPGYRFFEGHLIDVYGNIVKKYDHGHLGLFSDKYYAGQKAYETAPFVLQDAKSQKTLFSKAFECILIRGGKAGNTPLINQ
jgi:hypothetical protein